MMMGSHGAGADLGTVGALLQLAEMLRDDAQCRERILALKGEITVLNRRRDALAAAARSARPVAIRNLWQPSVSATATTAVPPFLKDEIAGAIAVAPGCAVSLSALSALSGAASMTWAEVPA